MNVKEYAQEKGISLNQAYKETGLQYWNQKIASSKSPSNDKGRSKKRIKQIVSKGEKLRKLLGEDNLAFLEHVAKYREHFPETYKKVKHLIDRKV